MDHQEIRSTLDDIKRSHSLVDYARSCGINIHRSGQTIRAPYQFRSDDRHPSFTIWHNGAKDFATDEYYDLFRFVQVMKDCSFVEAVQEFAPGLFTSSNREVPPELIDRAQKNKAELRANIQKWHEALCPKSEVATIFANPECVDPFTGEVVHVLDYLHSRGITDDTITEFMLGYDAKTRRLIIPFIRNGAPVYYAGRDLTTRYKQVNPSTGSVYGQKYKYPAGDYGVEKTIFGLDSIRLNFKSAKISRKNLINDVDGTLQEQKAKEDTLFICEGLLDAVILIQNGWQVLCTGGGAFGSSNTPIVLDIMGSFPQVVLAFDNDTAGQRFTERMGDMCIANQVKFTVAEIPQTVNDHPVKDINDYCLAGGSLFDLVLSAKNGLAYLAESMDSVEDIYRFVKKISAFADPHDLLTVKTLLKEVKKVEVKVDPDAPDIACEPRFKKGQVDAAFSAASAKVSEKVLADRVLAEHNLLLSADGKFYEYNGQYWEVQTENTIKRYALEVQGSEGTIGRAAAVMNRLKAVLETKKPFNTQHIFPAKNGVFLLDRGQLVAHNPQFMNTSVVGYAINPDGATKPLAVEDKEAERIWAESTSGTIAMCRISKLQEKRRAMAQAELPLHALFEQAGYEHEKISAWQEFCATTFVDKQGRYDPQLEREAQLMAGYVFCPDNRLQTGYLLLGEGGNGKSTFMEILKDVFGREVCAFLRPDRLSSSFDVMLIRNAWVNFCHESAKNMNGAEETLKSVISGDPITGSYKSQDAVSFQSRAKWIISANSIMDIKDVSYGFLRRMVCLPFYANHTRNKKPDVHMLERLHHCMNEIFWWCYQGYLAIQKGARPGQSTLQKELAEKLRETIDTCYLFTREELVERRCPWFDPDNGAVISDRDMFKWYVDWCKETYNEILPQYTAIDRIVNAMRDIMPEMVHTRLTKIADKAERNYFVYTAAPIWNFECFDEASRETLCALGVHNACEVIDSPSEDEQVIHEDISPLAAGAPESEDKASAGEAGTGKVLYPHATPGTPEFGDKIRVWIEEHPDTWHTDLTDEEFMVYADCVKEAESAALYVQDWDEANENHKALIALREGWQKRKQQITPDTQGDDGSGVSPVPPESGE